MAAHAPVESELKYVLDAGGHRRLVAELTALLGPPARLEQCNRFYDSVDGRLQRVRASLRLRLENQRLQQTCKRHLSTEQGHHRHLEQECWLSTALWPWCQRSGSVVSEILPLPPELRPALAGAALQCFGGFDNLRLAWRRAGEAIALDRTDFGSRIDFELEVETEDAPSSHAWWSQHLQRWGLPITPQALTKLHRFLALSKADESREQE